MKSRKSGLRICLIYNANLVWVDGRYYLDRPYGRYVESLLPHVGDVILCNPIAPSAQIGAHLPVPAGVSVHALPYYSRWTESYRTIPLAMPILRRAIMASELIYLRIPSPLALVSFVLSHSCRRPTLLHIVGDQRQAYDTGRYRGLKSPMARVVVEFNEWSTQCMVNRSLTIVQGEDLAQKHKRTYNRVFNLIESPISVKDVVERTWGINDPPVRLIYIGALIEKKGVDDLIEALPILNAAGVKWDLKIIGTGRQESDLRKAVEREGVGDFVHFMGPIYAEEELFSNLRRADICIIPSRAEGVPRVIFEAMAAGVVVIATRVGGIPGIVTEGENGLLVSPAAPSEIAEAIVRLMREPLLFERLVQKGKETALLNTRERHATRLFELISEHLSFEQRDCVG